MKILVCICTYKRNKNLKECLESFNKAIIPDNVKISFLILDNTINYESSRLLSNFKKKFKFDIQSANEKKKGVVYARNKCLKISKKIECDYITFFDDDCKIDKYWFKNVLKILGKYKVNIVTGPQLYLDEDSKKKNLGEIFEKKVDKELSKVSWAATNNVIFKKDIILKENIYFDINLNKFGMGEDQLFFSKLYKKGYEIIWSNNIKVFEKLHYHRLNKKWIKERSYRLGVLGNYIDRSLNGQILGYIINYFKFLYYLFLSIFSLLNIIKKNYPNQFINLFFRSIGRFLGPFVFKKIKFYKK